MFPGFFKLCSMLRDTHQKYHLRRLVQLSKLRVSVCDLLIQKLLRLLRHVDLRIAQLEVLITLKNPTNPDKSDNSHFPTRFR
jgi:hypothetical protein